MPSGRLSLRAIIQFLVLLIGVAFESVRTGQGQITPFLLSAQPEWFRSYVYNFCEHLKFITLALMSWQGSRAEDYKTDKFFVFLAVLDFLDYIVTGNNLWYSLTVIPHGDGFGLIVPVSMNVVGLIVFGFYAHEQWKTNGERP